MSAFMCNVVAIIPATKTRIKKQKNKFMFLKTLERCDTKMTRVIKIAWR